MSNDGFERPAPIDPGPGRSGGGGFRVVGIVLVVLGLGMVLVCAGGVYWVSQNEAVMEGLQSIADSQNAPGTEELRAAGCDQAMVLDPTVFLRMAAGFSDEFDELQQANVADEMPSTIVICNATGSGAPSCPDVARVYVESVGSAEGPFMVQVASGGSDPCQEVYAADGEGLGDLESWARSRADEDEGEDDPF